MKNNQLTLLALAGLTLAAGACKKTTGDPEKPAIINAQEQITSVLIEAHDLNNPGDTSRKFTIGWEDLDGAGGANPVETHWGKMDTGIVYTCSILLVDKSKTPFDTISREVEEKGDIHRFFYYPDSVLSPKIKITPLDVDKNNLPIGLRFSLDTRNSVSFPLPIQGNLRVILSHYDGVLKSDHPSSDTDLDIEVGLSF